MARTTLTAALKPVERRGLVTVAFNETDKYGAGHDNDYGVWYMPPWRAKRRTPHRGSKFEDFLAEDGTLGEVTSAARTRVRSFEVWMRRQLKDPVFKAEYDRLEPEFAAYREKILSAKKKQSTSTSAKPRSIKGRTGTQAMRVKG